MHSDDPKIQWGGGVVWCGVVVLFSNLSLSDFSEHTTTTTTHFCG
jgi:hypothetical protein